MTVALIGTASGISPQSITVPASGVPGGTGNQIVIFASDTSPTAVVPSVADSASNSYLSSNQVNWDNVTGNGFTIIMRERTGGALHQNDTITYTASIAGNLVTVAAIYITGLINVGSDGIASATGSGSGAVTANYTPTVKDDLVVAAAGCKGTQASLTQSSTFTAVPGLVQLTGPALIAGWALAQGTNAISYTATLGTASVNSVVVTGYRMTTTDQCQNSIT